MVITGYWLVVPVEGRNEGRGGRFEMFVDEILTRLLSVFRESAARRRCPVRVLS